MSANDTSAAVGYAPLSETERLMEGLEQLPTPGEVVTMAEAWRPYRTTACHYLWGAIDATPQ